MTTNVLGTLLADVAAHPDAAPFALPRVFLFDEPDIERAEQAAIDLGYARRVGVRFDTIRTNHVTDNDEVVDDSDDSDALVARRKRYLYEITEKGKVWLSFVHGVTTRMPNAPSIPKHKRYAAALVTSPRDVFELSEVPWRCKMPEIDRTQQRRVARFLARRRAARLSAAGEGRPKSVEWIALDWRSPTAASLTLESTPAEPSTAADNATTG